MDKSGQEILHFDFEEQETRNMKRGGTIIICTSGKVYADLCFESLRFSKRPCKGSDESAVRSRLSSSNNDMHRS